VKGEITIVVRGAPDAEQISQEALAAEIRRLIAQGSGLKQISEQLGERYRMAKREVYQLALRLKSARESS
jgi:16S rRNA C1402 (ribose-2'-O) methylase RsmI